MSHWYPLHRHYRHRPPSPDPCSVIIPSRYSTRRNYELMVHWALPRQLRQQQNTNHCRDSSKWWCFVCPQRSYNPLDNHMHKDRILKLFECLNDWGGEDRHPKTQEKNDRDQRSSSTDIGKNEHVGRRLSVRTVLTARKNHMLH